MKVRTRRRLAALPRWLASIAIRAASPALWPVDRYLVRRALQRHHRRHGPIFIVGAPRSGSTLLYKVVTDAFGFSFFNNLSSRFFRTPYLGVRLSKALGLRSVGGFEIKYGSLRGWGSPNECGLFWYRWFPRGLDVYAPAGFLSEADKRRLREEIAAISLIDDRSMAFKNLFNSMRIGALVECFPDATFVVCRRDPVQNALSLLKGRIENLGDKSAWWTLPPRQVSSLLGLAYPEQVAGQVYWINRQIESDMDSTGRFRFFVVDYEDFCRNPHLVLRRMSGFLRDRGHAVALDLSQVPPEFEVRLVGGIGQADRVAVQKAVETIYGQQSDE